MFTILLIVVFSCVTCCAHADNDGVVFTPVAATYIDLFDVTRDAPLLKWKFLDENTIDFLMKDEQLEDVIRGSTRSIQLNLLVEHQAIVHVATAEIDPARAQHLLGLCQDTRWGGAVVVECGYRPDISKWDVRRVCARACRLALSLAD